MIYNNNNDNDNDDDDNNNNNNNNNDIRDCRATLRLGGTVSDSSLRGWGAQDTYFHNSLEF